MKASQTRSRTHHLAPPAPSSKPSAPIRAPSSSSSSSSAYGSAHSLSPSSSSSSVTAIPDRESASSQQGARTTASSTNGPAHAPSSARPTFSSAQSGPTSAKPGHHDRSDGSDMETDEDEGDDEQGSELGGDPATSHELDVWHYLPLLFFVLPLLGGLIFGRSEAWADGLVIIIVVWWMYFLFKTPWELYHSSLHHVLLDPTPSNPSFPTKDPSPQALLARTSLIQLHTFYLGLTLAAPLVGAALLSFTRAALSEGDRYVNTFSIRLFLLASAIKPVSNLVGLLKGRNAALKKVVGRVTESESERLDRRLALLERELGELRDREKTLATRRDVDELRAEVVGGQIGDLAKAIRRGERKGELVRLTLGERFDLLATSLSDLQAEVERDRNARAHQFSLSWLFQLLRLHGSSSSSRSSATAHLGSAHKTRYLPPSRPHSPPAQNRRLHPLEQINGHGPPSPAPSYSGGLPPSKLVFPPSRLFPARQSSPNVPPQPSSFVRIVWKNLVVAPLDLAISTALLPLRIGGLVVASTASLVGVGR